MKWWLLLLALAGCTSNSSALSTDAPDPGRGHDAAAAGGTGGTDVAGGRGGGGGGGGAAGDGRGGADVAGAAGASSGGGAAGSSCPGTDRPKCSATKPVVTFAECNNMVPRPGQPGLYDACARGYNGSGADVTVESGTAYCVDPAMNVNRLFVRDCAACSACP